MGEIWRASDDPRNWSQRPGSWVISSWWTLFLLYTGITQVSVEISSVIRASPQSFRVAWTERHYDSGQLTATERWTAILSLIVETPRDADRLRKNPLGVYVNSINWSKEFG